MTTRVFLLFQLGGDRYALETRRIAEVVPLLALRSLPQAPRGVAGVFDYRGAPVPVIDLSEMAMGHPAPPRLSTRIILVNYAPAQGESRLLGLIAERAIETVRRDEADFADTGISVSGAPYLGPVCSDARGFIQWVDVDQLLSAPVREALFARGA